MFNYLQHLKNGQIAKQSYFCKQLLKSPILTDLAFFKDQMAALIDTHTHESTQLLPFKQIDAFFVSDVYVGL